MADDLSNVGGWHISDPEIHMPDATDDWNEPMPVWRKKLALFGVILLTMILAGFPILLCLIK